ncbi:hypothetical protein [Tepidibacillus decaturensis]|uniref:Uncharacterized protein n=1 Tax=Tepidibacillus decaturensis TaxID=1413211 RepID=A0A135L175_9BACI|nr:hypothetical protein [Tepidibacillus decaturensis]KXG42756.1 hypothetical protein U473_00865 [Tepidibacillus decaturensis]
MNIQEIEKRINETKELTSSEIHLLWKKSLEDSNQAKDQLKFYYMKSLLRIKPLYAHIEDHVFYTTLEQSVTKALERGLKFRVEDYKAYMNLASQTYFKYFLQPKTESLHVPSLLYQAFLRLEGIFAKVPLLQQQNEQKQIELLSKGFEYPIFSTRLLYYSYLKWKQNQLRQVDIDLTVSLLPAPQRVEWEIFYEKSLEEVEKTILTELK